jgi:hypothetical protein
MTPESQRIAIAEACDHVMDKPEEFPSVAIHNGQRYGIPDYLNDLNAAIFLCDFLAERSWNCTLGNGLDKTWECEFYKSATDKTHPDNLGQRDGKQIELHYGSADTLAEAISEAFLRTLGLWKDDASHLSKVESNTASIKPK